jgi:4-hydroxy-2-oxoheptanedioate aldolase
MSARAIQPTAGGRLNKLIELIENGGVAFGTWVRAGAVLDAIWVGDSSYDFALYDLEHDRFDVEALRTSLQFMLNPRRIAESALAGTPRPAVVPVARIPANGREHSEWLTKLLLDVGLYGVVFPTINTVDEARHALQSMRYPQAEGSPDVEPLGRRGYAPAHAMRYWGLDRYEYYRRADAWPLDPQGELLPIMQCETAEGLANLPAICRELQTPGLILISAGDLSLSLGLEGRYTSRLWAAVWEAARICADHGVPFGSAQGTRENVEELIGRGCQMITFDDRHDVAALHHALTVSGRAGEIPRPVAR